MKNTLTKKVLAVAVVSTMTLGSSLVALADGVTGNGIVEYDNSVAIEYDKVDVPTLNASTYDFTIDPTGQLHEYTPGEYDAGTVYFSSTAERATVAGKPESSQGAGDGVTLYKASYVVYEKAEDEDYWEGVVTVDEGEIDEVNENFFIWQPDATDDTYETGQPGKMVALDDTNIDTFFELDDAEEGTITIKGDYKAGVPANVCDGNIYTIEYTAVDGNLLTDSDLDPLSNYITLTAGAVSAVSNLYTDDEGTAAGTADVVYTAPVVKYRGETDAVTVINLSTESKTVSAKITLNNVDGITFKATDSYTSDTATSMYMAATNGTNTAALVASEDGTKASVTYTAELDAPTVDEVTYMSDETNSATGGHNFYRYEGYGTEYSSDSFKIVASANPSEEADWDSVLSGVTADTKPSINIVYTVRDTSEVEAEEAAAEEAAAAEAAATAAANGFKTTYAAILAKTNETVAAEDLEDIDAALTAYEALSAAAKAKLTTEKALLDGLKTTAEALAVVEPTVITATYVAGSTRYELALPQDVALSDASDVTDLEVNGEAIGTFATNGAKTVIRINRADVKAALGAAWDSTSTFEFTFTANGVDYTATVGKNG